jgi:NAD(P)-dependent dehydrogenase (short-subunit alcohol dehydrogenase family)
MITRGYGRLVYLSTGLSRQPREGMITLGTAKAALDQFVRFIALELAPHGITANLVAPATVEGTKVTEQLTPEQMRQLSATNPMRSTWFMLGAVSTRNWSPMLPTKRDITRMKVSTSPSAMGSAGKQSVCAAAPRSVWAGSYCRG